MHRKLKKSAVAVLALAVLAVIGLVMFFNRPKSSEPAATPEAVVTPAAETAVPDSTPAEDTASVEEQEQGEPIQLTDSGEIVIELDEDEETMGE